MTQVAPLTPEESERLVAREQEQANRQDLEEQHRERRTRQIRAVALVALVLVIGWWAYGAFIAQPDPLPLPVSVDLRLSSTPDTWPSPAGDTGATRSTPAGVPLDADVTAVDLGAPPAVAPVADSSSVYVALTDGRVIALDAQDHTERWAVTLQNPPFASPVIAGAYLYVPLRQGAILALDVENGEVAWESESTPSVFLASPVVADGVVYAHGTRSIHGFDAETGTTLWSEEVDRNSSQVSPVIEGNYIAAAGGQEVQVFDRRTGEQTYFFEFVRAQPAALLSSGGVIYPVYGRLSAAFEESARRPWWDGMRVVWAQLWVWGMAPEVPPPPSLWNAHGTPGEAYPATLSADHLVVAGNNELVALDRRTGEEVWRVDQEQMVTAPISTADGVLLAHSDRLTLIDPGSGDVLGERSIDELQGDEGLRSLALTTDGLYLVTDAGRLLVLR